MKNQLTLKEFCEMYSIRLRTEEQWYKITNNILLNGFEISNYGRLKNKTGLIRLPLQDSNILRYKVFNNNHYYYFRATDIMCQNITELYQEDKYLGIPDFINNNESDCYIKNLIPFWSKSKISDKEDWKKIKDTNLILSINGDILRKSDKMLLRPTRRNRDYSYYIQNYKKIDLTAAAYELFNKKILI